MRMAFAPLLVRSPQLVRFKWRFSTAKTRCSGLHDFACVALLDANGHEHTKAYDSTLSYLNAPIDYSRNPLFLKDVPQTHAAHTGTVYVRNGQSFFDVLYPLENGQWMLTSVRWDSLKKVIFDQQVGLKGYIWLVDDTGQIIGGLASNHFSGDAVRPAAGLSSPTRKDDPPPCGIAGRVQRSATGVPSVGAGQWIEGSGWFALIRPAAVGSLRQNQTASRERLFLDVLQRRRDGRFRLFLGAPYQLSHYAAGGAWCAERDAAEIWKTRCRKISGSKNSAPLGKAFNQMTRELKAFEALQVEKIIEEKTTIQSLLLSIRRRHCDDRRGRPINLCERASPRNGRARMWPDEGKTISRNHGNRLREYPPWMDTLQPVIDNQKQSTSEEFEFPVEGRARWARVLAQQVLTDSGRRIGVMVVLRDITQEKELERMKEDFFNGITHDLRTPLAATIGYLGLSEMQVPESEAELSKLVSSARASAKRALSLVETILSLARLQAGKLNLNRVPVPAQIHYGKRRS